MANLVHHCDNKIASVRHADYCQIGSARSNAEDVRSLSRHAMRDFNMPRTRYHAVIAALAAALNLFTSGCANSPSINVLGAYFPEWMFCIVGGVLLTVALHAAFGRTRFAVWLRPTAVVYPAALLVFALLIWLISFQR